MFLRNRFRNQANADTIQSKEQLFDMFQQILNIKKFEHQIVFNALQLGKWANVVGLFYGFQFRVKTG